MTQRRLQAVAQTVNGQVGHLTGDSADGTEFVGAGSQSAGIVNL